ncbi:MAG: coiled-coil protein [Candidatus Helarchaeota archaeon]
MEATLELVDLKNKFKLLRSRAFFYNEQAKKFVDLRNQLNRKVSELMEEVKQEKRKRNELNKKVSELKKERNEIKKQLDALYQELEGINPQLKSNSFKGKNPYGQIKKQINKIEWVLQTKQLTPAEEKELMDKIDFLEAKLAQLKDVNKIFGNRKKLKTQIEMTKAKLKIISDKLYECSQESQVHHNRMVELLNKIDTEVRVKADEAHQKFLEAKSQADEFFSKSEILLPRIKEITKELGEFHDMKNVKIDKVKQVVENRVDKAVEKFKAGKRLTLEEFTLLVKRGML